MKKILLCTALSLGFINFAQAGDFSKCANRYQLRTALQQHTNQILGGESSFTFDAHYPGKHLTPKMKWKISQIIWSGGQSSLDKVLAVLPTYTDVKEGYCVGEIQYEGKTALKFRVKQVVKPTPGPNPQPKYGCSTLNGLLGALKAHATDIAKKRSFPFEAPEYDDDKGVNREWEVKAIDLDPSIASMPIQQVLEGGNLKYSNTAKDSCHAIVWYQTNPFKKEEAVISFGVYPAKN